MRRSDLAIVFIAPALLLVSLDAYGQVCTGNADCDDGLWCNGPEFCRPQGFSLRCQSFGFLAPCTAGEVCDELRDQCVALECSTDAECDDGVFCNGQERCRDHVCRPANGPVCSAGGVCDEINLECTTPGVDADGDGVDSAASGGTDCDDADPNRFPGNTEICDVDDHDEDCDPFTFGERDLDGDGYIDFACCNIEGQTFCGNDCNDDLPGVHPFVPEVCNGLDDDCNGEIDDGVSTEMYTDLDRDLFGDPNDGVHHACLGTQGLSIYNNDCDDRNPAITPGSIVCDPENGPNAVRVCGSADGSYMFNKCSEGVCITLPNGTGHCELRPE